MQWSTGTTELNHSYYTGNSLSALHSSQQFHDDTVSTSVHPLVSTQETNGTTSSGSPFGPQLPHGPISSPVLAGPTRNVTSEAMPTSLAEAVTQLSFLEFLQRCKTSELLLFSRLSYQSPFHSWTPLCRRLHPVMPPRMRPRRRLINMSPRYLLTWQCRRLSTTSTPHLRMLLCRRSHTVLFLRTFLRRWILAQLPCFLLTCLFRLLYAVLCCTIFPHNYRSRSSLMDVSSRTILLIVSARRRHKVILVVSHCLHFLTLLRLALSAVPVLTVTITSALWPHVSCCSPRRVSNSMRRLQVSLLTPTCALHMAHLLKRHLCDPGYVQLSQSRPHRLLLVPSMWEHIMRAQPLPAREVLVLLWREPTILSIQILVQVLALFLNREPSFFLWSNLVNPNLKGTVVLIQPTVISCIIKEILPTLSPLPVVGIMQLFFKKPATTSRTSLSSSLCAPSIRTLLSCSVKTPSSLTLLFSHVRLTPQDGLAHCSRSPATSISLWITDCYFLLSTHSQCCG